MHPLLEKLSEPELGSVRVAVIEDMANRRNAGIAAGFALAVWLGTTVLFAIMDVLALAVLIALPIAIVVLVIVLKARQSRVLFALAGTGLTAEEKRTVVRVLARDPEVRTAVTRAVQAFATDASRSVASSAARAARRS